MGAFDKLPEQWKSQKTADAVMAPSAIVLGGAGAAAAILGGLPLLAIAGVGGLVYLARVAMLLPRGQKGAAHRPHEHLRPVARVRAGGARRAAPLPQGGERRDRGADA